MREQESKFGGTVERMEKSINQILKEKAEMIEREIREITPNDKKILFDSIRRLSKNIPEAVITGGTALRIYLESLGKKVPVEFGRDIDCAIERAVYDRIRDALPPSGKKESIPARPNRPLSMVEKKKLKSSYRRRAGGGKDALGDDDFLKDPENHIALEDRKTHYHIDVFSRQEITSEVRAINLKGRKINLLSPEELLMRRMSSVKRGIEDGELQRRHVNYFYLTGQFIDEVAMDKLWEKVRELKKDIGDWRQVWHELDGAIQHLESNREIKEKVIH